MFESFEMCLGALHELIGSCWAMNIADVEYLRSHCRKPQLM